MVYNGKDHPAVLKVVVDRFRYNKMQIKFSKLNDHEEIYTYLSKSQHIQDLLSN